MKAISKFENIQQRFTQQFDFGSAKLITNQKLAIDVSNKSLEIYLGVVVIWLGFILVQNFRLFNLDMIY